ncbi:MAG: 2-amino-4-hydroxy-6-hydroxymethyldihydropteridine diphosphokinase [Candidatus Nanopelagicales bacterium]|nr:2-amino-4-hydroxy-6-hydroxymethyldihydropteridine diphosphokinase [Candidatus Nanopelagicales bacterium]
MTPAVTPAMNCGWTRAAIGLGSNLGDRQAFLDLAVDRFAREAGCLVRIVSDTVETDPVGGPPQPSYLNAVMVVETVIDPRSLLVVGQDAERIAGRDRSREVRWGPRVLDVDLLAYGDRIIDDSDLRLPHPRALERGFVLRPWAQVDPEYLIPGIGLTVAEALAQWVAAGHTLS